MTRAFHLMAAAAAALALAATVPRAASAARSPSPPSAFVTGALCVHAGRHFTTIWHPGAHVQYALWGHVYYFEHDTYDDIPHGPVGADGEGPWPGTFGGLYGGGMSFSLGTWNRAARISGGAVPYASSTAVIAAQPPAVQILAAYLIVGQDHGDWGEWPNTSRECGI